MYLDSLFPTALLSFRLLWDPSLSLDSIGPVTSHPLSFSVFFLAVLTLVGCSVSAFNINWSGSKKQDTFIFKFDEPFKSYRFRSSLFLTSGRKLSWLQLEPSHFLFWFFRDSYSPRVFVPSSPVFHFSLQLLCPDPFLIICPVLLFQILSSVSSLPFI